MSNADPSRNPHDAQHSNNAATKRTTPPEYPIPNRNKPTRKARHIGPQYVTVYTLVGLTIIVLLLYCILWGEGGRHFRTFSEKSAFPIFLAGYGAFFTFTFGEKAVNAVLQKYNSRLLRGLSQRKVQIIGDESLGRKVRNDLVYSDLIISSNILPVISKIERPTSLSETKNTPQFIDQDVDLVILAIDADYGKNSSPTRNSQKHEDWKIGASEEIRATLEAIGQEGPFPALVVLTPGTLSYSDVRTVTTRAFSTLVNARGRIVSDIHSLLTTLPPRS